MTVDSGSYAYCLSPTLLIILAFRLEDVSTMFNGEPLKNGQRSRIATHIHLFVDGLSFAKL